MGIESSSPVDERQVLSQKYRRNRIHPLRCSLPQAIGERGIVGLRGGAAQSDYEFDLLSQPCKADSWQSFIRGRILLHDVLRDHAVCLVVRNVH